MGVGPLIVTASTTYTAFFNTYTLTSDAYVYYDLCIDGISTGASPYAADIELDIEPAGGSSYFTICAVPLGPTRVAGILPLPKSSKVIGQYVNGDSVSHYISGFIIVVYPVNI
jgi:hypothetical protein